MLVTERDWSTISSRLPRVLIILGKGKSVPVVDDTDAPDIRAHLFRFYFL